MHLDAIFPTVLIYHADLSQEDCFLLSLSTSLLQHIKGLVPPGAATYLKEWEQLAPYGISLAQKVRQNTGKKEVFFLPSIKDLFHSSTLTGISLVASRGSNCEDF